MQHLRRFGSTNTANSCTCGRPDGVTSHLTGRTYSQGHGRGAMGPCGKPPAGADTPPRANGHRPRASRRPGPVALPRALDPWPPEQGRGKCPLGDKVTASSQLSTERGYGRRQVRCEVPPGRRRATGLQRAHAQPEGCGPDRWPGLPGELWHSSGSHVVCTECLQSVRFAPSSF